MRDARVSEFAAPRRPQGHRKDERDFPIPIARSRIAFSDIDSPIAEATLL